MGSQGATASVCQILELSERRNLSYLYPNLGYLKSAVRSRLFGSVSNKDEYVVSSTEKIDLSFGFNDTT